MTKSSVKKDSKKPLIQKVFTDLNSAYLISITIENPNVEANILKPESKKT